MHNVKWSKRSGFAEFAEAIGISTDSIMAVSNDEGLTWVLYTDGPTDDPEAWIHCAVMSRDEKGILRVRRTTTTSQLKDLYKRLGG